MEKKTITYEEFKFFINSINDYLKDISERISSTGKSYQDEIDKIESECEKGAEEIIKDKAVMFEKLYALVKDHPMIVFANKLKTTALIFPTYQGYSDFSASNINEALMKLNIYINGFKELKIKLEKYDFNTGLEFHFSGEHLFIDDKTYEAPDFPELTLRNFDTAKEQYKSLILEASTCLEQMKKALEYIIAYYKSDEYKATVKEAANNIAKEQLADTIAKKEEAEKSLYDELNNKYENIIAPTLKDNSDKLRNYINMARLKMPDVFKENINIGTFVFPFSSYDSFIPVVKDIDKYNLIEKNMKFPCELDLVNKGNVLINANKIDRPIIDFLYQLVLQYIVSAPLKKVHLALVDVDRLDEFDFAYQFNKDYLRNNNLLFTGKIACDGDEFKGMLNALTKKIDEVKADKLSPKDFNNIFEYNKATTDTQEIYLLVYANSPKCLNEEIMDKIVEVMVNGPMCGVFSLVLNNTKAASYYFARNDKYNDFMNTISSKSFVINYRDGRYEANGESFTPNYAFREDSISRFFKALLTMDGGK